MKYNITKSRLLYVYTIADSKHRGLLKIGEVLVPNNVAQQGDMSQLMHAVREVIDKRKYAQGTKYHLEYVECTTYNNIRCYTVQKIHDCLHNSGVESKYLSRYNREDADIWFQTDIETVRHAIEAVKQGKKTFNGTDATVKPRQIVFRPEQQKAIADTVKHFSGKTGKRFLWNAKMRFGKTLSGLEVAHRMEYQFVLIVTHRPVVDKGWGDDFDKIFSNTADYYYASRMDTDEQDTDKRPNHVQNIDGERFQSLVKDLKDGQKKGLVMFVSMQYLRLSTLVGGKNNDDFKRTVMEFPWQLVMIDEAHEGTESTMGKRVIDRLMKDETNVLSLSGTPFNLLDQYDDGEIYTWDYVMEQNAKRTWDNEHYGDPNPYADLPRMQILTFTLSKMLRSQFDGNGGVFKFHEFFRVLTGNKKEDGRELKAGEQVGDFMYKDAVKEFLDRLVETSATSEYPFSTKEFRQNFRHTFWLLPYVKEAKAMENLLHEHKIFKNFHIINVAGDGNMEDPNGSALKEVQDAIRTYDHTITLSCGKLTTGVSVPEWTAVLCMKGSEDTPAANYMQTIFRVQTHAVLGGRQKSDCFVFDFAPDRALTAVAETAKMQVLAAGGKKGKPAKQSQKDEELHLQAFLQLCPVISMDGAQMGHHFSASDLFVKLNDVYVERAVRSGYSDNSLYNVETLLNLSPDQEQALADVHGIVGSMPNTWKPDPITVNSQGFAGTDGAAAVQYVYMLSADVIAPSRPIASAKVFANGAPMPTDEDWQESVGKVTPLWSYCYVSHTELRDSKWGDYSEPVLWREYKDTTSGTTEADKEKARQNKEKQARMSVLRGVSIRIPLLVYGAELQDDEDDITIDNFTDLIDPLSWEEYMPHGFNKSTFNKLKDCFDRSIFTGAARRIRQMVKAADTMNIEDRINQIAAIFRCFHNPDKETVLTPWRVVNMQLSDTLGGWCFYNDRFDDYYKEENEYHEMVNSVRPVDRGKVTADVFGDYNTRILEINSKTGLYPLYMAYSVFKSAKEKAFRGEGLTGERGAAAGDIDKYGRQVVDDQEIWEDVLQDNIFVVCRTRMAASITRRTLAGFRKVRMNVVCYEKKLSVDDLVSGGVIQRNNPDLTRDDNNIYAYKGKKSLLCDMIDVLRAKPELFRSDIVKGRSFWHVYNSIPIKANEDIENMKFTAIVGNPPYQLEGESTRKTPIYHLFYETAIDLSPVVTFITPGRFLFKAGQTPMEWMEKMLADPHFKVVDYFLKSTDVFPSVDIKGGVAIGLRNANEEYGAIGFFSAYKELISILKKVKAKGEENICELISSRGMYKFTDCMFDDFPQAKEIQGKGSGLQITPNSFESMPFVFTKEGNESDCYKFLGRVNNSRTYLWIKKKYVQPNEYLNTYNVFVPEANGTGAIGEVLSTPVIGVPVIGHTDTFLSIGKFADAQEASACLNYVKTKFARCLLGTLKATQHNPRDTWANVPLQDFTPNSDIDWSQSIDDINHQLYAKYGLTDDEIAFIEKTIKPME